MNWLSPQTLSVQGRLVKASIYNKKISELHKMQLRMVKRSSNPISNPLWNLSFYLKSDKCGSFSYLKRHVSADGSRGSGQPGALASLSVILTQAAFSSFTLISRLFGLISRFLWQSVWSHADLKVTVLSSTVCSHVMQGIALHTARSSTEQ